MVKSSAFLFLHISERERMQRIDADGQRMRECKASEHGEGGSYSIWKIYYPSGILTTDTYLYLVLGRCLLG